ncbi:MAG TPA: hypothetical protein VGD40_07930 [Chryseosolibacter sp.]
MAFSKFNCYFEIDMDSKGIPSGVFASAPTRLGRIFFLLAVIGFSFNPVGTSAAVPFKTELHEEVMPRVSRRTWSISQPLHQAWPVLIQNYVTTITALYIRFHHQFRIFKERKRHWPAQIGLRAARQDASNDEHRSAVQG